MVDLFAGSGALGVEALSRGAAEATFVDRDAAARRAIAANLATTGLADRATVVGQPVERFLAARAAAGERPFDLAFCDPPYAFDGWGDLLAARPAELVVAESGAAIDAAPGLVLRPRGALRRGLGRVPRARRLTGRPAPGWTTTPQVAYHEGPMVRTAPGVPCAWRCREARNQGVRA